MMFSSIKDACLYIAQKKLAQASSGNLSTRTGSNTMYITATGTWFEFFEEDYSLVEVEFGTGQFSGVVKPSCEWLLHSKIYQARPDIQVILHYQSVYATLCGYTHVRPKTIPEMVYIREYRLASYNAPGSELLANSVSGLFAWPNVDLVQMLGHGQVVGGRSLEDVIQKAIFFELACELASKESFTCVPGQ